MCSDASEFADLYKKEDCFDLSCDCVRELYRKALLKLDDETGLNIIKTYILLDMQSEVVEDPMLLKAYIVVDGTFLVYLKDGSTDRLHVNYVRKIER